MKTMRQELKDSVEILTAVNVLEFHDKNWLTHNQNVVNRDKQEMLERMAEILEKEKLDDIPPVIK